MKSLSFFATVLFSLVSVAAQSADFKRFTDYKCNGETVSVFDCRNDPGKGQPVHPLDNVCLVEYPDRPRRLASIAPIEHIVHAELAKKLSSCTKPPSSDAGVAKAQAAKVDTVVFGIQLGEPFDLPKCPMLQIGAGRKTCYSTLVDEIAGMIAGPAGLSTDARTVFLGVNECPSWVNECKLVVTNFNRKVGIVDVYTKGPNVDTVVVGVLKEKYGKFQGLITERTVTPGDRQRAAFKVTLLTWLLPGLTVTYEPVWADDGHTPNIDEGIIRVETETARKARSAAPKAPKPKM